MPAAVAWCYVQFIAVTYAVSVLMGAPLLTDFTRTLLFSIVVVAVGFTPLIIRHRGNAKAIYDALMQSEALAGTAKSREEFWMRNLAWGTIAGAWLGAIPIPLDWDRWWQRWPITCLVSALIGAGLSVIVSQLWLRVRWQRQKAAE